MQSSKRDQQRNEYGFLAVMAVLAAGKGTRAFCSEHRLEDMLLGDLHISLYLAFTF